MSVNMIVRPTLSVREIIDQAVTAVPDGMVNVEQVAAVVDMLGHGDRVTTRQIRRQLVQTGRA